MPALAAIRNDENFKSLFSRLVAKHGIKMKAVVAVQRKLPELMYTLYRTGEKYDVNYLKKNEEKEKSSLNTIEQLLKLPRKLAGI